MKKISKIIESKILGINFEDDFGIINVSGVGYLVYFNNRDR
jgi:hypothetical protein